MGAEESGGSAGLTSSPAGYALVGLALVLVGSGAASWRWGAGPDVWAGCLLAWGLQTVTFWPLWRTIRRGERALRVWIAGITARVAGLGAIAGVGWLTGAVVAPAAIGYGLTLIVLLWAEGFWLVRALKSEENEDLWTPVSPPDP
ncbi:MAG: hypothetical protein Q8W44_02145 [Candidatus Palauibacterales bacterium]|nr:hypothetical protein [Candidatus Palauibacterales bacterium]